MNARIDGIVSVSSKKYKLSLVPVASGFVSISLAKTIVSSDDSSLVNPPTLEFNYLGAEITSSRVVSSSTTSITLSVATSKPTLLWALFLKDASRITPSATTIMSEGQVHSALSTHHILILSELEEDTKYVVYLAGKEEKGTLMNVDVQATMLSVRTKSSASSDLDDKSDGSVCKNGWAVSSTSNSLELVPCSRHGYCRQQQCVCLPPYTGESCNEVREVSLDRTNSTHQLIPAQFRLYCAFSEFTKLEAYWKVSLRESGAGALA